MFFYVSVIILLLGDKPKIKIDMKKTILLMLLCFSMTILSAQETRTYDTKDSKVGEAIKGRPVVIKSSSPGIAIFANTSGDYLVEAGRLQLFGVGLSVAGAALMLIDSKNEESNNDLVTFGIISGASGFLCSIVGHVMVIKAGKALNKEKKISFHPSSEGIGLAMKF